MMESWRTRSPNASWQRRVLSPLAEIIVAIYVILDGVFRTLFRPLTLWLAKLRLIIHLEALIAKLPAYGVLSLLVLPFAFAEPAKVYAVYLMSTGHLIIGLVLLVAAYFVSVLVVDRIFHAGKAKLLTIPWFAKLWTWISNYKEQFLTWMKSTYVWKRAGEIKLRIRDWLSQFRWLPIRK